MPPMIATLLAIPKDKEHELDQDQEFELDVRISSVTIQPPEAFSGVRSCVTTNCATVCGCPTARTGGCCYG